MRLKSILAFVVALVMAMALSAQVQAGSQYSGTSWKLTNDGGVAIWLTNTELRGQDASSNSTNNTIPAGAVCVFNSTFAGGVQLSGNSTNDGAVPFMVAENSTHPGQGGWFIIAGVADVLMPMGQGSTLGKGIWVEHNGASMNWQYMGRCNATETFNSTAIGYTLETVTGTAGDNATKAKAMLIPQRIPSS